MKQDEDSSTLPNPERNIQYILWKALDIRFECFFISRTAMRDDWERYKFTHRNVFETFGGIYSSSRFPTHIRNEFLETKPVRNSSTFPDTWTLRHKHDCYLYSANILRPSRQGRRHQLIINYKSWFYIHWPSLLLPFRIWIFQSTETLYILHSIYRQEKQDFSQKILISEKNEPMPLVE